MKTPSTKLQNLYLILNISKIKKRRQRISVLKSPHVNKNAQEQFQSIIYGTVINCSSWEMKKNSVLLKKIKNRLFPDIKLKIEKTFKSGKITLFKENQFNPKKVSYGESVEIFSLKNLQKKKILTPNKQLKNRKLLKKAALYLKLLDNYGSFKKI